jgi:hypothetical protein
MYKTKLFPVMGLSKSEVIADPHRGHRFPYSLWILTPEFEWRVMHAGASPVAVRILTWKEVTFSGWILIALISQEYAEFSLKLSRYWWVPMRPWNSQHGSVGLSFSWEPLMGWMLSPCLLWTFAVVPLSWDLINLQIKKIRNTAQRMG